MPNSNQKSQKTHNLRLGLISDFYVPHQDANHSNAQDIIHDLVNSTKNISIVTWNCFEDGETLVVNHEIVANLILEIQTKLEMIEKILPLAFKCTHVEG